MGKEEDDIYDIKTKWGTNKDLLYSIGNSAQYSAVVYMGKESKKSVYMYMHN